MLVSKMPVIFCFIIQVTVSKKMEHGNANQNTEELHLIEKNNSFKLKRLSNKLLRAVLIKQLKLHLIHATLASFVLLFKKCGLKNKKTLIN